MKSAVGQFLLTILFSISAVAEEAWRTFKADSHLKFDIPDSLQMKPGSGEGEEKWISYFSSADGAFRLKSNGFNRVDRDEDEKGGSNWDYIRSVWLGPHRKEVTYVKISKPYMMVITVDRKNNVKKLKKFWIGHKNSSGYGVKSLTISYPWDRRKEFDPWMLRIESSWRLAATWTKENE